MTAFDKHDQELYEQHQQAIITAHERRLAHLYLREAQQGIDTPPDVLIEIASIENKLKKLRATISTVDEPFSLLDIYKLMHTNIMRLDGDIFKLERSLHEMQKTLNAIFVALVTNNRIESDQE